MKNQQAMRAFLEEICQRANANGHSYVIEICRRDYGIIELKNHLRSFCSARRVIFDEIRPGVLR
jgi:hypothetical protein